MKNEYKISALVHSALVASIVREQTLGAGWDIPIKVTSYENALEDARQLFDLGAEAVLCHGGFREAVFKKFGRRIIYIERSEIDLVRALVRAREMSRTIALTAHINEARDIEFMERLLDIKILPIRYETASELEEKIVAAIKSGVLVFVGGGGSARIVHRLGGKIVLDEPQPMNILNALGRALVVAENARMEQANMANIQTILQYAKEGVICLNSHNQVVYHNAQALKLLHVDKPEEMEKFYPLLGLDHISTQRTNIKDRLVNIRGLDLLVNYFPLQIPNTGTGVVCFIHDVRTIRKIHRKIENDLHSRGLVASHTLEDIRGESAGIRKLRKNIKCYGPTDISVYIKGETGTGKELAAHALHMCSKRASKPFVGVNCAALPDPLLESELFGYEEGAFTGAKRGGKAGLFEIADGGSIFLDEIGDMSPSVQVGLLRVLDTKEIMRVGGDRFIAVNVRIICASHKELTELVRNGKFRMDLYFRLTGVRLDIPPLRERMEDIPCLLKDIFQRYNKSENALTDKISAKIYSYTWPGNIREIMSVMEAYLVLLGERAADDECFEEIFTDRDQLFENVIADSSLASQVADFRKKIVFREVARCNGNRNAAATKLGISMSSLRRILDKAPGEN